MTKVWVRPQPGLTFRDPATRQHVPAGGLEVEMNTAWRRALNRGDVVRCEPPRPSCSAPIDTAASISRGGSPSLLSGTAAS
jgi:hypothetical protein